MEKKKTLSTMLTLFVAVITVIALGGMTVWADPEPASFDIDPDTYTITHSGYSDIDFYFESINYGKVQDNLLANGLALRFYCGTLSCGDNSIPFYVSDETHVYTTQEQLYVSFSNHSNDSFSVGVYIDPELFRSVPAGRYTGTMNYTSTWYTGSGIFDGEPGSVGLTLVVPDQNENILEFGRYGNIFWTFDRSGTLTINGRGDMGDFGRTDTPWESCIKEIKDVIILDGITSVGKNAFSNFRSLESISLPDTLITIREDAFYGCDKLALTSIPDSVTSIGDGAFQGCEKIKLTSLPSNLNTLGKWAFAHCYGLESMTIPGSLETVEYSSFDNCRGLKTLVIEDGVKTIGRGAFESCNSLSSLTIADSVEEIGGYAFSFVAISSVDLPDNLTTLSEYAFQACSNLSEITIPSGVESIGAYAFSGSGLKSAVISEGVKSIETNAFYRCKYMTTITLPSTLTKIGYQAFDSSGLTSVDVPASVTDFGNYAFVSCSNLKTVTLHEGLTTIPACAFYKCYSLKTINIPSSVTYIGENAFIGCTGLEVFDCFADPDNLTWIDKDCNDFKDNGSTKCRVPFYDLDTYIAKFSTGNKETDVNVTFISNYDDVGLGDILYGFTVCLEGDIGVNFFIDFKNYDALSDNAQMIFTITNLDGTYSRTQKVFVKPQSDPDLPCALYYGGYYIFKCNVSSKEMTSTITAQIVDGDNKGTENSYSVQEYAAYILANPNIDGFAEAQDLVKAMLNYGAYSQIYFDYNTANLANSILSEADKDVSSVTADTLNPLPVFKNNLFLSTGGGTILCEGASLSLESKTKMNLFFSGDLNNVYFTCNGKRLSTSVESDGSVKASVDGIPAQNIDEVYTITLYRGDYEIGSISYSPINYCYNVLSRDITPTRTAELKNVVRALCLFNQEADAFI